MTNLNINFKKMLKETKFNAARIIIVGFLCVIIVGINTNVAGKFS